ncbi:serum paraoxonase/arylesterase 1-like [Ruditapes philippinarum]|uniref:serum paraoxonase/arylesterase 1-like n=1 Tax=Ruditapes philippinarum TaxID=129788 RepID=UPI00295B6546|nr:serum paraoxonase/arylesterase 1-like [Ruditapes philippinarum]
MWYSLIMVAVFGLVFQQFLSYRDWMDWSSKDVMNVNPGACETIIKEGGSEDITHIGNGIMLMSTGFGFLGPPGKMKAVDLNNGNKVITLNMTNIPSREDFLSSPHGITTWRDPNTDQLFLYVVTHPPSEDHIEVFEVLKSLTLRYVKTIKDPKFDFMNDLVAVGKDKFYITYFARFRDYNRYMMETLMGMKNGAIFYYDGHRAREVASGFHLPNGINISPNKKVIYLAEAAAKKIRAFRRDSTNNLVEIWSNDIGTIPDNIDVDPDTGDLWIGSHPILWKAIDTYFGSIPPCQVLRLKMRENTISEIEMIYQNDGTECTSSTVASYTAGKMIIGTVHAQALVCDVGYLSKN